MPRLMVGFTALGVFLVLSACSDSREPESRQSPTVVEEIRGTIDRAGERAEQAVQQSRERIDEALEREGQ